MGCKNYFLKLVYDPLNFIVSLIQINVIFKFGPPRNYFALSKLKMSSFLLITILDCIICDKMILIELF